MSQPDRRLSVLPELVEHFRLDAQRHDDHTLIFSPIRGRRNAKRQDKWVRKSTLGQGAFGLVWLEQMTGENTQELRAVKEIRKTMGYQGDFKTVYARELYALARLNKFPDHFVEFYGWYETNDCVFLSMEYFPCGDLTTALQEPPPESEAQDIVRQLLAGVGVIHREGITHRDLKPENIFVVEKSPHWWVKIGDFGISKRIGENSTILCTTVGTLLFMAPEVLDEDNLEGYTSAVDIWALGCITYLLLAWTRPFQRRKAIEAYGNGKGSLPVQPLRDRNVTEDAIAFIQSLLSASPEDRPPATQAEKLSWMSVEDDQGKFQEPHSQPSSKPAPELPTNQNFPHKAVVGVSMGDENTIRLSNLMQTTTISPSSGSLGQDRALRSASNIGDQLSRVASGVIGFTNEVTLTDDSNNQTQIAGPTSRGEEALAGTVENQQRGDRNDDDFDDRRVDYSNQNERDSNEFSEPQETENATGVYVNNADVGYYSATISDGSTAETTRNSRDEVARQFTDIEIADAEHRLLSRGLRFATSDQSLLDRAILRAAKAGIHVGVWLLIDRGAGIEAKDDLDCTPLHFAAMHGHLPVAKILLDNNAKLEARGNKFEETPLHLAARCGYTSMVKLLLDRGSDIEAASLGLYTPLALAAEAGRSGVLGVLLERGANTEARDRDRQTPLHLAVSAGQTVVAQMLIDGGARIDATNKHFNDVPPWQPDLTLIVYNIFDNTGPPGRVNINSFQTPLHLAAGGGHADLVQELVDRGASIDAKDAAGQTPLYSAASRGYRDVVEILLSRGASPDGLDIYLQSPLHYAASNGHASVTALLLSEGAPSKPGLFGRTPLHFAALGGHLSVADLLLAEGVSMEATTKDGPSALIMAVYGHRYDMMKLLLDKGADVHAGTTKSLLYYTPLHAAVFRDDLRAVQLLLLRGADPKKRNNVGQTAVSLALSYRRSTVMLAMLESGEKDQKVPAFKKLFKR